MNGYDEVSPCWLLRWFGQRKGCNVCGAAGLWGGFLGAWGLTVLLGLFIFVRFIPRSACFFSAFRTW